MTIRTKLTLMTSGLVCAVVLAVAAAVTAAQRSAIEDQSRRRLQGLTDGVARLAQESIVNRDRLMLFSYLMHLQKEHAEFAFAAVSSPEHTSTIGADRPGLIYWTTDVAVRRPIKYTISTISDTHDSLSVSTAGVSLSVAGSAQVTVEEGRRPDALALKLGFDAAVLEAEIAKALDPLTRRTAAIAGAFMFLGWLGALSLSKLLTTPLSALATAVSAVKSGDLDVVVAAGGSDELGLLAKHFNSMTAHLKVLTQFREDLLHTLTHELNTPLGGLKGYLELWNEGKIPAEGPQRDEVLQTMTAAVLRMENSLGNALGLFRTGSRTGVRAPKRSVWLHDLLSEACSLFAPEAAAKKISFVLPPEDQRAYVHADPELLRQIVANLVSNAVKYTPEQGHIRLSLEGGENDVRLRVADDGCGIAAEDLPHLFTKFYRAGPDADRRRVKGTGLGLNIAMKSALALGGTITVASEPGRGSTFTVTLPKFAPQPEAA
ncbi:MAG: HAMP domain-containing histidine kinase [Elusimicrobia bacterium]|nr:HAMP domain-containing histidine kinase [Elusimicrobiota bacterium]